MLLYEGYSYSKHHSFRAHEVPEPEAASSPAFRSSECVPCPALWRSQVSDKRSPNDTPSMGSRREREMTQGLVPARGISRAAVRGRSPPTQRSSRCPRSDRTRAEGRDAAKVGNAWARTMHRPGSTAPKPADNRVEGGNRNDTARPAPTAMSCSNKAKL
jgi:hypothetical protein